LSSFHDGIPLSGGTTYFVFAGCGGGTSPSMPKPYLVVKETLLKEAMKQGGNLKKKDARIICKVTPC
jgi:hypothetical protein